jgi:DNA-binding transcriptional LysR family regulator
VFPSVEIRHLLAVIALAEELNFRRAADRLHITQPALSKQITDLETVHRFHLFTRDKRRIVELTDAGRLFVEEPAPRSRIPSGPCISLVRRTREPIAS